MSPYLVLLTRGWWIILSYGLLTGGVAGAVSLVVPSVWVSRASLVASSPDTRGLSSTLAAVAGGLDLGGLTSDRSSEFYKDLLTSRRVLDALLHATILNPKRGLPGALFTVYLDDSLTPKREDQLILRLQKRIQATVDARTGVIRVAVGAPDPALAAQMAESLLAITNHLAIENLQSRAHARRLFTETQAALAKDSLESAEDNLRLWYEHNRRLTDSPELQFEEARLKRRVDLRQDSYLTLTRDLEQARIDEVKDTPVLNIIDPPVAPTIRESPKRRALAIFGFVIGAMVAAVGLAVGANRPESRA